VKITQVDTLRLGEFSNIFFILVHTDEGLSGLGETFYGARAVEAYVHETAAPYLLGKDPLQIERHANALYGYLGYRSSGAETRGNSAVDIALWDLFGKATGQPLYQLLSGRSRETVRTYNTCAGYRYSNDQNY
jgi:galactonate dehydratase